MKHVTLAIGVGLYLFFFGSLQAQTGNNVDEGTRTSAVSNGGNVFNSASGNQTSPNDTDIVYKPIGYGYMEVGQIISGYYKYALQPIGEMGHVWQQRAYTEFGYDVTIKKRLQINISGGGLVAYSTPQVGLEVQTMQTRNFFFLKTSFAGYSFDNWDNFGLKVQAGYFPFKYNPDVRNLGEYLFRANSYPLLVYSDFDYPKADLLGVRFHTQYQANENILNVQNDLLFHSELYSVPVQDWSLSDVLSASLFNTVTIGGGVSLCNWFSVYQGKYGADWVDKHFYPDTSNSNFILKNATDTALFDWKSTKVMARFSFDPKRFLPPGIFGENDFILYGEADFMGLKNYPLYYTDLKDRTFYSTGFNVPGFKFFDVANVEIEYCRDTSAYSNESLFAKTPGISPSSLNAMSTIYVKRNPYRLSFYIKKSILGGHVSFIAQCARDHKKINFYYFALKNMSFIETLPASNNWWWVFKTEFKF